MDDKLIGVLVWGIRNGFRNNWLSHNVESSVMENLNDEMRQICNSTIEPFYSVEIIAKYLVITIYNPNAVDHVQRRAYIALSVVVPLGTIFSNLKSALDEMLLFYKQRQANSMSNMITPQQLLEIVIKTGQPRVANYGSLMLGNKLGHYQYVTSEELVSILNELSFSGYKKVYFDDGNNMALKQIPGVEAVQSFKKSYQVQILGHFDANRFVIKRNGRIVTGIHFPALDGDIVEVLEPKADRRMQYSVSKGDLRIQLAIDFPQSLSKSPRPTGGGGKSPGPRPPGSPNVPAWLIVLTFFVILSAGIAGVTYSDELKKFIFDRDKGSSEKEAPVYEGSIFNAEDSLIEILGKKYAKRLINITFSGTEIQYNGCLMGNENDSALLVYFQDRNIISFEIKINGKFKLLGDNKDFKDFSARQQYLARDAEFLKLSRLEKSIPVSSDTCSLKKDFLKIYFEKSNTYDTSNYFSLNVLYVNLKPSISTPTPPPDIKNITPDSPKVKKRGPVIGKNNPKKQISSTENNKKEKDPKRKEREGKGREREEREREER